MRRLSRTAGAVKEVELAAAFAGQAEVSGRRRRWLYYRNNVGHRRGACRRCRREKCNDQLPIFASLAYDPAGDAARTMMGVAPADAVKRIEDAGITAVGFNCGTLDMPAMFGWHRLIPTRFRKRDCCCWLNPMPVVRNYRMIRPSISCRRRLSPMRWPKSPPPEPKFSAAAAALHLPTSPRPCIKSVHEPYSAELLEKVLCCQRME